MKCKKVQEYIITSGRGKYPDKYDDELQEHLRKCDKCRAMIKEYEIFVTLENKQSEWKPSDIYWNSLLPRIHMRITKKKDVTLPSWIYKLIAPAAGLVLMIFISLSIFRINGGEHDILPKFVSTDIEEYYQQKLQENQYDILNTGDSDALSIDDVIVIENILNKENSVASYYEEKAGSLIETLSEDEASKLLVLLDNDFKK